ncbi:unnamed protein product [Protopolystoma xenopodis]|uniref:Uncharacterized protein n=1 Tax=Protopolystoma xenopodis TaxID=117903 RepID=A0A448X6Q1_9PLAT|nr:unnamed protein product [Protopolystoma xenopodis]
MVTTAASEVKTKGRRVHWYKKLVRRPNLEEQNGEKVNDQVNSRSRGSGTTRWIAALPFRMHRLFGCFRADQ